MEQSKLIIHYDIDSPIDAEKLGKALTATTRFYQKHLKRENYSIKIPKEETRLYISEIKNNCILCEFIPALINSLPTFENIVNVSSAMVNMISFFSKIKDVYSTPIDGESINQELVDTIPTSDLKDARDIICACSSNGNIPGSVDISYEKTSESVKTTIKFNPIELKKTITGLDNTLNYRNSRKTEYIQNAKLQLVQFNKEIDCTKEDGHSNDKGRISDISPDTLPIIWETESIAISIKAQDANPTKKVYIVAVHVQRNSKQKPIAYHVLELKNSYTARKKRSKKSKQPSSQVLPGLQYK